MKLKNKIRQSLIELLASIKNPKIIWILSYDLCFILLAGIVLKIGSKAINWQMQRLGIIDPQALTPEIIGQQLSAIKTFAILFFIIAIILYLLLVIDYSLFRGWMWTKLLDKKPTKKYMQKLLGLNMIWVTIWLLLLLLGVYAINKEYYKYMIITGTIIYIHLTTVLHHAFTYKQEIKNALKKAFSIGLAKIKGFILPYIYIIIIYAVLMKALLLLPIKTLNIIGIAVLLIFLAWYRTYMNDVILEIQKKR